MKAVPITARLHYRRWRGIDERAAHSRKGNVCKGAACGTCRALANIRFLLYTSARADKPPRNRARRPEPRAMCGAVAEKKKATNRSFFARIPQTAEYFGLPCRQRNFGKFGKRWPQRGPERAELGSASSDNAEPTARANLPFAVIFANYRKISLLSSVPCTCLALDKMRNLWYNM